MILSREKLKELVVDQGYIRQDDFELTAVEADNKQLPLDLLLVEKGMIKDETLGQLMADYLGHKFVDLKRNSISEISTSMLGYIPETVAYSQKAIVVKDSLDGLEVATSLPENYNFLKFLEKKSGKPVKVFYATPWDIQQALKKYKGDLRTEVKKIIADLKKNPVKKEQSIVELVNLFLEYAYINQSSDIHIEPLSEFTLVRFRIDGILSKVAEYPKDLHNRIVSRLKIMSKLRTDEKSAAQDGRFRFETKGYAFDVRVSIMPVTEGENVVMRLLTQRGKQISTTELGLLEADLKKLYRNAKKPYGMILSAGPTGSGKTTTLYSILQLLNRPEVNITTIEDPVEYKIEGIQQTQVNTAKDITFPTGLRSIVRQDPDIIMVGEIRDEETMSIAINSAMTGHLVLSTVHANDAATTFPRLLDMGAEPFLVASSINVVIAQRLVRKICEDCKEKYNLSMQEIVKLEEDPDLINLIKKISGKNDLTQIDFYRGRGCSLCGNTGYFDRTAIFEILEVGPSLHNLIIQKASADEIRKQAQAENMTTMSHDGIAKVLQGLTTLEEIGKVTKL